MTREHFALKLILSVITFFFALAILAIGSLISNELLANEDLIVAGLGIVSYLLICVVEIMFLYLLSKIWF